MTQAPQIPATRQTLGDMPLLALVNSALSETQGLDHHLSSQDTITSAHLGSIMARLAVAEMKIKELVK